MFGVLKEKLQGIDVSDDEELKSEILMIFQDISSDELKKAFHYWKMLLGCRKCTELLPVIAMKRDTACLDVLLTCPHTKALFDI
jgi:hypothetical protein